MNIEIRCDRGHCSATLTVIGGAVSEVDCNHYRFEGHRCVAKWPPEEPPAGIIEGLGRFAGEYLNPVLHLIRHSNECQFKLDDAVRTHIASRIDALRIRR